MLAELQSAGTPAIYDEVLRELSERDARDTTRQSAPLRAPADAEVIDTTLLASAILLTLSLRQYPFVESWLTAKVLLLVLYVALGHITLKRAHTRLGRTAALAGSLVTFVAIIGVAIAHHPAGWLHLIHR